MKKFDVPVLFFKQLCEMNVADLFKLQLLGNLRGNGFYYKFLSEDEIYDKDTLLTLNSNEMLHWIIKKYSIIPQKNELFD